MLVMTAAMAFAFAACGNKAEKPAAGEAADSAKEKVEAAAEAPAELSPAEEVKAELKSCLDKIRAVKSMEELDAVTKEIDAKFSEIDKKIKANPEIEKALETLGDEYNFDKVMEDKMKELLKK